MLSDHWPFFALRIRTPRLELRYPTDGDLERLVEVARERIHDEDFMPFTIPWTRERSPVREQNALRFWWRLRAGLTDDDWTLPFMVVVDGEPVGAQDIGAKSFSVTRAVSTGSWLVQRMQGQGIGKEMRAAVLHLAFANLGAREAHTSAFEDNPRSIGVTRALGYQPNGSYMDSREGKPARHLRFILDRERWETRRRDDIDVENVEPCLALLGAS